MPLGRGVPAAERCSPLLLPAVPVHKLLLHPQRPLDWPASAVNKHGRQPTSPIHANHQGKSLTVMCDMAVAVGRLDSKHACMNVLGLAATAINLGGDDRQTATLETVVVFCLHIFKKAPVNCRHSHRSAT